jgi:hypothetical protein
MKIKFLLFTCALILIGVVKVSAQADSLTLAADKTVSKPTNCEFNISVLDAAHSKAGSDSLVIIIARLGDRENRRNLNHRRLHNIRTYLKDFVGRDTRITITAQGDRIKGYGRIEIYVKGQHFYTLMVGFNLDFAVGECSYDGRDPCTLTRERNLYPCFDRKSRSSHRKKVGKINNLRKKIAESITELYG